MVYVPYKDKLSVFLAFVLCGTKDVHWLLQFELVMKYTFHILFISCVKLLLYNRI